MEVNLINGCIRLRSTCGSVSRSLLRTTVCGSHGLSLRLFRSRGLGSNGTTRLLGSVSKVLVTPKFKRHNVRKGFTTLGCTHRGSIPYLNVYLNVRYVIVRFTHGMVKLTRTGSARVRPGAPCGIVSLVRRRGGMAGVNNSVHLKTCSYVLGGKSGTCRTCKRARVRRHRQRHFRFGDRCHSGFRTTNVVYMNRGPRSGLIRIIRVPTLG